MVYKLFLIYCTLLAVFISVSGLVNLRSTSELPVHLVFLPVPIYLISTLAKQFKRSRVAPEISLTQKKTSLAILLISLLLLTYNGYISIQKNQPAPKPLIIHATPPSPTPTLPTLLLTHPKPPALINIRKDPTTKSEIITKLMSGTQLEYIEHTNSWYKVIINASTSGWLSETYATTSAQKL